MLPAMRRKCSLAVQTLRNCRAANADNPAACASLDTQVVHCFAEVVCPDLAAAHQRCFRRVVNSKGREPPSACDKNILAMRRCLKKYGLYPIK